MQIWDIFKKIKFVCGLNDEKIKERLLSKDMSLEEVFKMAQAMELVTADVVHIKNKDMEDLHKMCWTKQSSAVIQKGKRLCFGCGEKWHERCIQCPAWEKNLSLNVKRKIIFQNGVKSNNGKACHTTCKSKTHSIPLYMTSYSTSKLYVCKLEENGTSCDMEIDT